MIEITAMAHGGDGIGRVDGKAVFVPGGLVGDVLDTELVEDRGRYEKHRLRRLVTASPIRVDAPCPHVRSCGGCAWQGAAYQAQLDWKTEIVRSQLQHIGGVETEVRPTMEVGPIFRYRNRMDFRNASGRPALYEAGSHDPVALDVCLLLAPRLREVFDRIADLGGMTRLVLRAGDSEALAIAFGEIPAEAGSWGIPVERVNTAVLHDRVEDVRFRITGTAFFQVNTAGAAHLVGLVREAAGVRPDETMLDGFAGGGLFAATVGAGASDVVAVESGRTALEDLRHNTRGTNVRVIGGSMERVMSSGKVQCDVAVVDPPRSGLGRAVVEGLAATRLRVIASVSCDAASFARDARLLTERGFSLRWVQPVDLFPHTPHVEIVGRFERGGSASGPGT